MKALFQVWLSSSTAFLGGLFLRIRLIRKLRSPKEYQSDLLVRLIKHNQNTEIGTAFAFEEISDVATFQKQIGFFSYQRYRGYMRRQESQNSWIIVRDRISHEIRASSRAGEIVSIPRSGVEIKQQTNDMTIFAWSLLRVRGLLRYSILALYSPPLRQLHDIDTRVIDSNIGSLFRSQPEFLQQKNVLDPHVTSIRTPKHRYFCIALATLRTAKLSALLTANPATLLYLLNTINQEFSALCDTIESGDLPPEINRYFREKERLTPNKKRAEELRELKEGKATLGFQDLLPFLKGVVCWTTGSFRADIRHLKKFLPEGIPIIDLGYVGDGFIGTINLEARTNTCVPRLHQVFFEFTERRSWEAGYSPVKLLHELTVGQEYYVFITTQSGLYRYETNDIVRVTGKVHNTPVWEVVTHDVRNTNLVGEHLSESQVADAVESLNEVHDCQISQYLLLADQQTGNYDLYIESENESELYSESVRTWFDDSLYDINSAWLNCRKSRLLSKPTVTRIPAGTLLNYRTELVPEVHFDPQFDMPKLQYRQSCRLNLPKPVSL